jgi:hypothetical protein
VYARSAKRPLTRKFVPGGRTDVHTGRLRSTFHPHVSRGNTFELALILLQDSSCNLINTRTVIAQIPEGEARDLLAFILARFEDGFETSDLIAAKDIVTDCRSILSRENSVSHTCGPAEYKQAQYLLRESGVD